MKTIDPYMKLDGFSLQEALESLYCTFSSVLVGRDVNDSPTLYLREIPEMVFSAAVGAGWLPLAEEDFDPKVGFSKGDVVWEADWHASPKTVDKQWVLDHIEDAIKRGGQPPAPTTFTKNQAQRLVQFGDMYVERTYLDSFYVLLKDTISFHLAEGTKHEEHVKQLPKTTSKKQRTAYLQACIDKEHITRQEIARRAGVKYTVLVKWKNKTKPMHTDSSEPGERILLYLLFGEWGRSRTYRLAKIK